MPPPPLILFDLDDTLCDYSGARVGRLRYAYGEAFRRADVTVDDLDAVIAESIAIGPHGSDHFPDLLARYGVADPAHAEEARRWYHHNRFLGLELFPDARSVLSAVRDLPGVRAIGLLTNGPADVQRDKIDLLDLRSLVDFAVISGEVGVEKPDPRIFEEALRQGGATAGEAIYFGDSPEHDMDGARYAGIPRVWINAAAAPWPLETPAPEMEIATIAEAPTLLTAYRRTGALHDR
ncbi:MAG: HAD-IA family hydrolase [Chloroflexota bacterium]|nr:HAD-IA family hydrolase [Chloroflexota bacterium]